MVFKYFGSPIATVHGETAVKFEPIAYTFTGGADSPISPATDQNVKGGRGCVKQSSASDKRASYP